MDKRLVATVKTEKGKVLLGRLESAINNMRAPIDEVVRLGLEKKTAEATSFLITEVRRTQDLALQTANDFTSLEVEMTKSSQEAADNEFKSALLLLLFVGVCAIGMQCFLGGFWSHP